MMSNDLLAMTMFLLPELLETRHNLTASDRLFDVALRAPVE